MDEKSKNQAERFTEYLAAMAIKLIEAEKQRDEAQRAADDWYKHWQARMAELKTSENVSRRQRQESRSWRNSWPTT